MTVEELSQYLRFTRKTIYRLLKQGNIPAIRIGNKWRFDKVSIDRWLHQMEEVSARILVIDDDSGIRALFAKALESLGHKVSTAASGIEGMELVKQADFEMVFLDLGMPEMNGDEFLQKLKKTKPDLPVIIITGFPGSELLERVVKQGPFGVMNKPFTHSDIVNAVKSFLKVRQPHI